MLRKYLSHSGTNDSDSTSVPLALEDGEPSVGTDTLTPSPDGLVSASISVCVISWLGALTSCINNFIN
jgi:hypothetical protein